VINIRILKHTIDLLAIVGRDTQLRKVATTKGGEYAGPCPFCGGEDRYRVQPKHSDGGRRYCRGCGEDRWHDAIDYIMQRDNISFIEAIRKLESQNFGYSSSQPARSRQPSKPEIEVQYKIWSSRAQVFVEACELSLWSERGMEARTWLHARGLSNKTIRRYRLGYCEKKNFQKPSMWGMKGKKIFVPKGIVIPIIFEKKIWAVNVRLPNGKNKYYKIKGSRGALFGADNLRGSWIIILVEGEFDAMLMDQEVGDVIGVATLGSVSSSLNISRWGQYLLPAEVILVSFDADSVGLRHMKKLADKASHIHEVQVLRLNSGDKDITDYNLAGGDLWEWLKYHLERLDLINNLSASSGTGDEKSGGSLEV